jgi:release factor glutamine methyltransferase
MTISDALRFARQTLQDMLAEDAARDGTILLQAVLHKDRSYLYAFSEHRLSNSQKEQFESFVERRSSGEPIAYILGIREFWSLPLMVTRDTLIPRFETELLVELVLCLPLAANATVADLGTGSGAIACALATERPLWQVAAVDRSAAALEVAGKNTEKFGLKNVRLVLSDWFTSLNNERFHVIVSNPPYVALYDEHLHGGDLRFEPPAALVAGGDGLDDIHHLVANAPRHLHAEGWFLFEHGYTQGEVARTLMRAAGFRKVATRTDLAGKERVTLGQWHG